MQSVDRGNGVLEYNGPVPMEMVTEFVSDAGVSVSVGQRFLVFGVFDDEGSIFTAILQLGSETIPGELPEVRHDTTATILTKAARILTVAGKQVVMFESALPEVYVGTLVALRALEVPAYEAVEASNLFLKLQRRAG